MPDKASLIYNPSSGAPGFIIENVYCLPGVPSILKSMVGGLENKIKGGKKILSETISVNTVESEIAKPLEDVQNNFSNVEIGSYPFFRSGKIGVSIVMRSTEKNQLKDCAKQIQNFIQQKKFNQFLVSNCYHGIVKSIFFRYFFQKFYRRKLQFVNFIKV